MITAQQTRAARALLGWTQEMLADRAAVSLTALKRMESVNGERVFETTADRVRRALEAAGPNIGVMMDVSQTASRR
jgi:predicted transcriptional regulator